MPVKVQTSNLRKAVRLFLYFLFTITLSLNCLANDFEASVSELIKEKIGDQFSLQTKFDSKTKLDKITENSDKIKSVSLIYFSPESKSFKVLVILENEEKIELFGKFESFFEVAAAAHSIKFGEEITLSDYKILKVKSLKSGQIHLKEHDQIVGMQAKYNIPGGHIIKMSDLKKPPIIKENDPVTLLYTGHDISLKTIGIALSSGAVGEKIRVKNEKTGIVVFGEILDKNVVKVGTGDDK